MSEFDQQDMDQKDTNQNNGSNSSKEKEKEYEDVCFVCRRPESKAGPMMKLPNHVCVCNDCMQKTIDAVSQVD